MHGLILDLQKDYKKPDVVKVRSGDTVRVTQRVKEASKERLQAFEGLVIRTDRPNSLTYRITVRKLTFGVGVEKSFLIHSPNVAKVEIVKRAKVRRNYLSYMRERIGKSARLKSVDFDKEAVNEFAAALTPLQAAEGASTEVVAEEEISKEADESEAPAESEAEEADAEAEEEADGQDEDKAGSSGKEAAEETDGEVRSEEESEGEDEPSTDSADKEESA